MNHDGRGIKPKYQVMRDKIQPERDKYLPKHFETELRAFVSQRIASTNLKPCDVVEKLREVAKSWELVNLEVKFFDEDQ